MATLGGGVYYERYRSIIAIAKNTPPLCPAPQIDGRLLVVYAGNFSPNKVFPIAPLSTPPNFCEAKVGRG
jgi:hypothetical protein